MNSQHSPVENKPPNRFTRVNAIIAKYCMYFSVTGLFVIVAIVTFQVFGRYVFNDSPTWAENLVWPPARMCRNLTGLKMR